MKSITERLMEDDEKRRYVAETMLDFDEDWYDAIPNSTFEERVEWMLKNKVKSEKDADYYIEKYDIKGASKK